MSDVLKAANRYANEKDCERSEFDKTDLHEAWLAGAAWQREQDAKLAEAHGIDWDDSWGNACRQIAKNIRLQHAKQEAPLAELANKPCYARIENNMRNNCYSRSTEQCEYVGGRCAHCGKSVQTHEESKQ